MAVVIPEIESIKLTRLFAAPGGSAAHLVAADPRYRVIAVADGRGPACSHIYVNLDWMGDIWIDYPQADYSLPGESWSVYGIEYRHPRLWIAARYNLNGRIRYRNMLTDETHYYSMASRQWHGICASYEDNPRVYVTCWYQPIDNYGPNWVNTITCQTTHLDMGPAWYWYHPIWSAGYDVLGAAFEAGSADSDSTRAYFIQHPVQATWTAYKRHRSTLVDGVNGYPTASDGREFLRNIAYDGLTNSDICCVADRKTYAIFDGPGTPPAPPRVISRPNWPGSDHIDGGQPLACFAGHLLILYSTGAIDVIRLDTFAVTTVDVLPGTQWATLLAYPDGTLVAMSKSGALAILTVTLAKDSGVYRRNIAKPSLFMASSDRPLEFPRWI